MNDPIPNTTGKTIDLSAIANEGAPRAFLSLGDANIKYSFVHCCECGRGGHTGNQLFTVIKDVTKGIEAKACQDHVSGYVRKKDLKKIKNKP